MKKVKKAKRFVIKSPFTKKGLKEMGGAEKLKCIDIILKGLDENGMPNKDY